VLEQLISKKLGHVFQPILIFVSEERASKMIESKIRSLFQRGAEASSS
jgi:hypothetical protein